jgi:ornithine carbamoyltransferase
MLTVKELFEHFHGLKLAYVGDGNNVAHSLMLCCARLGIHCTVATPAGYEPDAAILAEAQQFAAQTGVKSTLTNSASEAVKNADVVYTDVWASMGQESEADKRRKIFAPFQVNEKLMGQAKPETLFMHCLPAKRGLEVTDAVMESPQCVAFDQAENRLHAQKALLLTLLQ